MLRFLLGRIPRFGLLTLFAAMLLFVSVAGWAKWNLDLWQEEEALLADIAEKGLPVTYRRGLADPVETDAIPGPWTIPPEWYAPVVERFSRIEEISFRNSAPKELLERTASLPYVRSVTGDGRRDNAQSTEAIAAIAGFELTPLAAPDRSVELPPLPRGERVDGDAKTPLIARFVEALDAERPPPPMSGTMYAVYGRDDRLLAAHDGETSLFICDGQVEIRKPQSYGAYLSEGSLFRQVSRQDDPSPLRKVPGAYSPLRPHDPGKVFLETLEACDFDTQFRAALADVERVQVERIDEKRIRIDLPAFVLKFTSVPIEDAYSISVVARSDLDWAIESWNVRGERTGDVSKYPSLEPVADLSGRSVLRRERDWIVPESLTFDYVMRGVSSPRFPDQIHPMRESVVAKYDFTSDLDLSHVTPEIFDAKMLPPQRSLPWLRWHRVTFALSLGLFAWVAARRLFARRRGDESGMFVDRTAA